jgi:acyl carrier protein
VSDDYFNLGGHSLLAVPLFSEIDREFKVHLPLATLFQARTVRSMDDIMRSA